MEDLIEQATIWVMCVTPKTSWIFVELRARSGSSGIGEATAQGNEDAVVEAFKRLARCVVGTDTPESLVDRLQVWPLQGLASAAALSAMDVAAWDIVAKNRGTSVAEALSDEHRRSVTVYANINRRTDDRTPEGFAKSAADALANGHQAIKIAPFDEATPDARREGSLQKSLASGLARMRAVRDVIGANRRLMIDCHWRLDRLTAEYVIDAAAEAGLYWVECPIPETSDTIQTIKSLRGYANQRGVRLAGCEEMTRIEGFKPFLDAGAYDVLMPDVKYVGGLKELLRLGDRAAMSSIEISPHNPSGPVCHAASLQVCAALGQDDFLEMQFDETPRFQALQSPTLPRVEGGAITLPAGPGLGLDLNREVLDALAVSHWKANTVG